MDKPKNMIKLIAAKKRIEKFGDEDGKTIMRYKNAAKDLCEYIIKYNIKVPAKYSIKNGILTIGGIPVYSTAILTLHFARDIFELEIDVEQIEKE